MTTTGIYIHGTEPDEQRRLSILNDLLNEGSLGVLALRPGEHVLDVGSGLGQLTRAMARAVAPGGRVIGVERSAEQLSVARRLAGEAGAGDRVDLREGDATDLPLAPDEWDMFDVAHARFLLEHLPQPLDAVRAMVGAIRPGGRLVLEDDDHDVLRLWPEPESVRRAWEAYIGAFARIGNDPFLGRKLVTLLQQAGAEPRRNGWNFFGSSAGNPDFGNMVANFAGVLEGASERIVAEGQLDQAGIESAISDLNEWGLRPDASLWYGVFWAEGTRPAASNRPRKERRSR